LFYIIKKLRKLTIMRYFFKSVTINGSKRSKRKRTNGKRVTVRNYFLERVTVTRYFFKIMFPALHTYFTYTHIHISYIYTLTIHIDL